MIWLAAAALAQDAQDALHRILAGRADGFSSLRGASRGPEKWKGAVLMPGADACDIDRTERTGGWNYQCRWRQPADSVARYTELAEAANREAGPEARVTEGSAVPDDTLTNLRISLTRPDGVRISVVRYTYQTGKIDLVVSVWTPP